MGEATNLFKMGEKDGASSGPCCTAQCATMHLTGVFAFLSFIGCAVGVAFYVVVVDKTEQGLQGAAFLGCIASIFIMIMNGCMCCKCGPCGKGDKMGKAFYFVFILLALIMSFVQFSKDPADSAEAACDQMVLCGQMSDGGAICTDPIQKYIECDSPNVDYDKSTVEAAELRYYNKFDDCDSDSNCRAFTTKAQCARHKFEDGDRTTDPGHVCEGISAEDVYGLVWLAVTIPLVLCFVFGAIFLAVSTFCAKEDSNQQEDAEAAQL